MVSLLDFADIMSADSPEFDPQFNRRVRALDELKQQSFGDIDARLRESAARQNEMVRLANSLATAGGVLTRSLPDPEPFTSIEDRLTSELNKTTLNKLAGERDTFELLSDATRQQFEDRVAQEQRDLENERARVRDQRNKFERVVLEGPDGKPMIGFMDKDTREFLDVQGNPILDPKVLDRETTKASKRTRIEAYDPVENKIVFATMDNQGNFFDAEGNRRDDLQPKDAAPSDVMGGKPVKTTEAQNKTGTFASRMLQSEGVFNDLRQEGVDRTGAGAALESVLGSVPGIGNVLVGEDRQRRDQAERNFVNAILRRESGAAIAQSEFDNAAKQYFPRVGDSDEVVAQKRRNRQLVIRRFIGESGPAWDPSEDTSVLGEFDPNQGRSDVPDGLPRDAVLVETAPNGVETWYSKSEDKIFRGSRGEQ